MGSGVDLASHDEEELFAFAFDADDVYLSDAAQYIEGVTDVKHRRKLDYGVGSDGA